MEKFGIFELLDALSAIALGEGEAPENQTPRTDDNAYAPPVYGAAEKDRPAQDGAAQAQNNTPAHRNAGEYAIEDFYRMHERRAKK